MTTSTPSQRSQEDWENLAEQIIPEIEAQGGLTPELREKYNIGSVYRLKKALARRELDIHAKPLKVRPIKAKRADLRAKEIANRRANGTPSWLLEVEAGMSSSAIEKFLGEHGFAKTTNGSSEK